MGSDAGDATAAMAAGYVSAAYWMAWADAAYASAYGVEYAVYAGPAV